jgi:uncharacterized DUF497 family protein
MPKWNEFIPSEIEYDFEKDKLHVHRITIEEAVQCFFNEYQVRKNKKYTDRYKLLGCTDAGRCLCIIFQLKQNRVVRIITGWEG